MPTDPVYTSKGSPRRLCLHTTFLWAEQDQTRMWKISKDALGVTEVWGTPPPPPPDLRTLRVLPNSRPSFQKASAHGSVRLLETSVTPGLLLPATDLTVLLTPTTTCS